VSNDGATDYRIAASVLEDIVKGALQGDDRLRVHPGGGLIRGRGVEVNVEGESCRVSLPVEARFGEPLLPLGEHAQVRVSDVLGKITGLRVQAVDVSFVGVFPGSEPEL
jgi:uncharacterized alkaline shock family protein YloU